VWGDSTVKGTALTWGTHASSVADGDL
jgi:hypothetical protein